MRLASGGRGRRSVVLAAMAAAAVGMACWVGTSWAKPKTPPRANQDRSRYGFESGAMGWKRERYEDSQAVTALAQSADRAKLGKYSLKLTVDLRAEHPNLRKGEVFVGVPIQSLKGKTIAAWVYAPTAAAGDSRGPNGLQVFVKDQNWNGQYGAWQNIEGDSWQQVTLTPSASTSADGWTVKGFNPTKIRAVGVKIGAGSGPEATYKGPIYVDAVNW